MLKNIGTVVGMVGKRLKMKNNFTDNIVALEDFIDDLLFKDVINTYEHGRLFDLLEEFDNRICTYINATNGELEIDS